MGADGVNHSQLWAKGTSGERVAAYFSVWSVVLTLSISVILMMPSAV